MNKIKFSNRELIEIFRCIIDTLDSALEGTYTLTTNEKAILYNIQVKIKQFVPNFNEELQNAIKESEDL